MPPADPTIVQRPIELLQELIRFDTTNPPGNEAACIDHIDELVRAAGFDTQRLGLSDERPNLVFTLKGEGSAPPLLFQGHVDVVTTEHQDWEHPPFSGELVDGYVWGRGALDMKSGVAMILATVLQAKADGIKPAGDVIVAILSDEEAGGGFGARCLSEQHPKLFEGVRYCIGELGGFPLHIGDQTFYLIQVGEKQGCPLRLTLRGPGGHGALPLRDGAMAKLGHVLEKLNQHRLSVHVTPVVEQMLATMAGALDDPYGKIFERMLDPDQTDQVLDELGPVGRFFDAMLHHTVSPTIVRGGDKINVIPGEVTLDLDGRMLPGAVPEQFVEELQDLIGPDVDIEVVGENPGARAIDMGLFDLLADILKQADPEGLVVPYIVPGATDGRYFAQLGIQPYGYLPLKLPADFNFLQTVHAANERVPADALDFGIAALLELLQRYGR